MDSFLSVKQLYKRTLRTANLMAISQKKNPFQLDQTKEMIRREFKRNMFEKDANKIAQLKQNAINGISNYFFVIAKQEKEAQKKKEEEEN